MPQENAAPTVEQIVKAIGPNGPSRIAELEGLADRAQAFFSDYATKIRAPHYGPLHREVIVELLKRAEEAQLYTPPKE